MRMDAHPGGHTGQTDPVTQAQQASTGWWPLDCLRSLGRAATIASGAALDASSKQHPDYRGFRILTTGQDGGYRAHVTHGRGAAIPPKHDIGKARFASHEEAAQYARFLIVSGALNYLGPGT